MLKENSPKSWYRAFFNMGLINNINGGKRMLPCEAGNWVVENKIKSMLGKEIGVDKIPYFNVGQNPLQGDLNFSRMTPFTDVQGVKPDNGLLLIED